MKKKRKKHFKKFFPSWTTPYPLPPLSGLSTKKKLFLRLPLPILDVSGMKCFLLFLREPQKKFSFNGQSTERGVRGCPLRKKEPFFNVLLTTKPRVAKGRSGLSTKENIFYLFAASLREVAKKRLFILMALSFRRGEVRLLWHGHKKITFFAAFLRRKK